MELSKHILSIQSWVTYGHVGNAAAVFPLQRLGFEVSAINTVQFSNHTGYGKWTGKIFPPEDIQILVEGMKERGALAQIGAVLSGYMGSVGTVQAVISAVESVRKENEKALYCLDPVMGDVGRGIFVNPDLPAAIKNALPYANIIVPNHFELEVLSEQKVNNLNDALEAAKSLREKLYHKGPRIVVVTSLMREDSSEDFIETLVVSDEVYICKTPLLPLDPPRNGTGDTIAALFLGHYMRTGSTSKALSLSMSALFALLECTHKAGTREIQLISAQDQLASPSHIFEAHEVVF